jgi:hypothetical protein
VRPRRGRSRPRAAPAPAPAPAGRTRARGPHPRPRASCPAGILSSMKERAGVKGVVWAALVVLVASILSDARDTHRMRGREGGRRPTDPAAGAPRARRERGRARRAGLWSPHGVFDPPYGSPGAHLPGSAPAPAPVPRGGNCTPTARSAPGEPPGPVPRGGNCAPMAGAAPGEPSAPVLRAGSCAPLAGAAAGGSPAGRPSRARRTARAAEPFVYTRERIHSA